MRIKPAKRILVIEPTRLEDINFHSGGIVAVSEKQPEIGRVVEVGKPGKDGMPLDIKKGDVVAYRRYGETKIFAGGKEYLFVGFEDILAVLV